MRVVRTKSGWDIVDRNNVVQETYTDFGELVAYLRNEARLGKDWAKSSLTFLRSFGRLAALKDR